MKWMHASLAAALIAVGASAATVAADDTKDLKTTARAVAKKTSKAIVAVRLSVTITVGDREPQDTKIETTGTVIDESGLTVIPASSLDPMAALGGFGGRGGRRGGGGGGQFQIDSEITSIAIVGDEGKEIEAEVVLKDGEIDLAFLKPRDASVKLDHVDLKAVDHAPELLDEVFCVGRLGRAGNHALSVATGQIRSVVKGTKGFYVTDNELAQNHLGCVVYGADGTPLGIFAVRAARQDPAAQPGPGMGGRGRGDTMIVVRPVSDIVDLAKQAKEKKVEKPAEKKTDEKKPAEKKPAEKKPADKKNDDF